MPRVGLNGGLLTNALQGSQRLFLFVSSVTALCTGSPLPHLLGCSSRHPLSELAPLPEPSRQADSLHVCGFHSFRQALVILGEATAGSCRECCRGVRWLRDGQGQSVNCRGNNSSSRSGCEQVSGDPLPNAGILPPAGDAALHRTESELERVKYRSN